MKKSETPDKIASSMAKAMEGRELPQKEVKPKPPRSEEIEDLLLECTLTVRDNIAAIIEAEQEIDTEAPLNYNQLGVMAGYGSSVIYQTLRSEPPRNMVGIQTLARLSLALGMSMHTLIMPPDRFKKEIIPAYKTARAARSASKRVKKD